ncbi:hypothetical protein JW935_07005 [candidate division KSB1 bacterium]|nr:hypothetical protein [candidate division KSB1 bacterium]
MNNYIIELLKGYDREKFADWLWRGLLSFYSSQSEQENAFEDVGSFVLSKESVCEGLAQIYECCVPSNNKLFFRQAIGDVVREHGNDPGAPLDAFRDLIYLMIRIKAYESLDSLVPTVGSGALGKQYPEIQYDAISALRSLVPSNKVRDVMSQLISCPNFSNDFIFEVVMVMVECDPSYAADIILRFEPQMRQLLKDSKQLGEDETNEFWEMAYYCAYYILQLGPIAWLTELWEKADHSEQRWLFDVIFKNPLFPIFIESELSGSYFIQVGSKRERLNTRNDYNLEKYLTIRRISFQSVSRTATLLAKDEKSVMPQDAEGYRNNLRKLIPYGTTSTKSTLLSGSI